MNSYYGDALENADAEYDQLARLEARARKNARVAGEQLEETQAAIREALERLQAADDALHTKSGVTGLVLTMVALDEIIAAVAILTAVLPTAPDNDGDPDKRHQNV